MNVASQAARTQDLDLDKIRVDGDTQGRVCAREAIVKEYARLMEAGVTFPPVRTWFDGEHYWLSDGFQRLAAARRIGRTKIAAEALCGTLDDARWDSYAVNRSHGVRRTDADVRVIVSKVIVHPRATQLSGNQIAQHLGIPETTFRRWRKRLSSPGNSMK